jgi:RimJ/RimL family protein N-acetyltransferase
MHVRLRALELSDIVIMHRWINDPEIIQHTNYYRPVSEMEQKEWFSDTTYFRNNFVFGIEHLNDKILIGTCGLYEYDPISRKSELRMKICDKSYRGKGIGADALQLLLSYGFKDVNLNRIWLKVLLDNTPAVKLYERAGFIHEGVLRNDMYIKGKYHDVKIMSIMNHEYTDD